MHDGGGTDAHEVSLRLDVLDLQIVDADGLPIGRVDDLELDVATPDGHPRVVLLLSGQAALGRRLGGPIGRTLERVARRLAGTGHHAGLRLRPSEVDSWGAMLKLRRRLADLPDAAPLERWLSGHVVGLLPGARREK